MYIEKYFLAVLSWFRDGPRQRSSLFFNKYFSEETVLHARKERTFMEYRSLINIH